MTKHFLMEMDNLKRELFSLAAIVEERLQQAVTAIETRNLKLAEEVIEKDVEIDQLEVELEEDCLKILALYQPVAIDLRFVVAVLKINNDLERIGDLAVNIAERAAFLATQPPVSAAIDFSAMANKARTMVRKSLESLVERNAALAWEVLFEDDEVDQMNREMFQLIQDAIRKYPDELECLIHLLSASRHLERVADHATNIAEDVIYLLEGEIVRHRPEDYRKEHYRASKHDQTA